jgi:hypothetical protein
MTALALRGSDVPVLLADQMTLARALAASGLLPNHLRDKPENVLAIQFAARSIDVPLWTAVSLMQVINGKVSSAAELQRALILRAGHVFRVLEATPERATVLGIRRDDATRFEHKATFTVDEARTAKLTGGSWTTHPVAMLVARATTRLASFAFADVIAGLGADTAQIVTDNHAPCGDEHAVSSDQPYVLTEQVPDEQEWPEVVAPALASASADGPLTFQPFDVEAWHARLDFAATEVELARCAAEIATGRSDGIVDEDLYLELVEAGKLRRRQLSESPVTW